MHPNRDKNTLFIVDEASLLSNTPGGMLFGSGNLLEDLVAYVFNGKGNQLLILGDSAQLPPIGLELSPALDPGYMEQYGVAVYMEMKEVPDSLSIRASCITQRCCGQHHAGDYCLPEWKTAGFNDVRRIESSELMECLNDAISRYGLEEVVVLCCPTRGPTDTTREYEAVSCTVKEGITKGTG